MSTKSSQINSSTPLHKPDPHHALGLPELIFYLSDFLDVSDEAMRNFALVCRLWFGVYVRTRWNTVKDPRRILAAFNSSLQSPFGVERFYDIYAPHIHNLFFDEQLVPSFAFDYLFDALESATNPLYLPNLSKLKFANLNHEGRFDQISSLMNLGITDFTIEDDLARPNDWSIFSGESFRRMLARIPIRMPHLRRLEVGIQTGVHRRDLDVYVPILQALKNVRVLHLPSSAAALDLDVNMGSRKLEAITFGISPEIVARSRHFRGFDYARSPIILCPDNFPYLTKLEVYSTHDHVLSFFTRNPSESLRTISLSFPAGPSLGSQLPSPSAMKRLHSAIARSSPLVESLSILFVFDRYGIELVGVAKYRTTLQDLISVDHLLPLSDCHRITSFTFEHVYPLSIDSFEVGYLTRAWPNLRQITICPNPLLHLDQFPKDMKRLDWRVIPIFARFNPLLAIIRMAILVPNVREYTSRTFSTIRRGVWKLQHLRCCDPGPYAGLPRHKDVGSGIFRTGLNGFGEVIRVYSFYVSSAGNMNDSTPIVVIRYRVPRQL
ncbi:hypothetical protein VNI00_016125 [Paramarasmius palmivorus]|uniref:F-box domain-containing protein n=1 Tax=Paramarasmius palmivorus TaxID=297713 RepID=A0AAW0BFE9_9AGAR